VEEQLGVTTVSTDTGETETGETETPTTTAEEPTADPEAGKQLFAANGCGGCHTFSPAGTTGMTGPNLDEPPGGKDPEYIRRSIVEPDAEAAESFPMSVMPSYAHLSRRS
jgi:mono/diheme cytochrome c family protein